MKEILAVLLVASTGLNLWVWNSLSDEKRQIAVALDSRQLEIEETHKDYARMEEMAKTLMESENKMIQQLTQTEQAAKNITDQIAQLDNETTLLQRVHQEFKDAWMNSRRR